MKKLLLFAIFVLLAANYAGAFKNQELKNLWDAPLRPINSRTVSTFFKEGIKIESVYYSSRDYNNQPVEIFGYFGYPQKDRGKLPAILLSHGGGGTASLFRVIEWAKRGYAVLAIDLPGKGENRSSSRSTGPDMVVANLLRTQPDIRQNYLIHAVAAARQGITYLTLRPEVDPDRIGMIGLSWGGVITLLTNGQDSRLKAAVNVFGAGYIPDNCTWQDIFNHMPAADKELWNQKIDPQNFLKTQHAPILFITGTNDHCYYLPIFQKSYLEVSAPKAYYLVPNLRHRFLDSSQTPALSWLDQKLKFGGYFPIINLLPITQEGENIIVSAIPTIENEVRSASLYYARGSSTQWTEKLWMEIKGRRKEGKILFLVPTALINPEIMFYISVHETNNGAASTPIRSIFRVKLKDGAKTFAVSSPITRTYRHDKPIYLIDGTDASKAYFSYSKTDNAYKMLVPR